MLQVVRRRSESLCCPTDCSLSTYEQEVRLSAVLVNNSFLQGLLNASLFRISSCCDGHQTLSVLSGEKVVSQRI